MAEQEVSGWERARAEARKMESAPTDTESVAGMIAAECDRVKEVLLEKNLRYGNSALDPIRIFSRADAIEQIKVRLDDKLSRLARGSGTEDEDVILDIRGYLTLLQVAIDLRKKEGHCG